MKYFNCHFVAGTVYNKDMAPKYIFRDRGNLFRHIKRPMVRAYCHREILKEKEIVYWCKVYFDNFRAAAMTLRTVLLSLQALLSAAEPDDPQDAVVAKQYKEQPDMFLQTAKHWTSVYAGGSWKITL